MNNNTYLFVDGNYLQEDYKRFAEKWFGTDGKLDFDKVRKEFGADRNFYFDAADDPNKFKDLQQSNWVVELGYVSSGRNRKQKEVDILMALRVIGYAYGNKMSNAILLAGDGDFRPLVHELVRLNVEVKVIGNKKSISTQLLGEATSTYFIDIDDYYRWTQESIKAIKPLEQIKRYNASNHPTTLPDSRILTKTGKFNEKVITLIHEAESLFYLVQTEDNFVWLEADNQEDLINFFEIKYGKIDGLS